MEAFFMHLTGSFMQPLRGSPAVLWAILLTVVLAWPNVARAQDVQRQDLDVGPVAQRDNAPLVEREIIAQFEADLRAVVDGNADPQ
ncbi:MAG: hypothetical protein ACTSUY_03535, partial [Alphaproteobacteria bacterium]